jgi:hypothetical protein
MGQNQHDPRPQQVQNLMGKLLDLNQITDKVDFLFETAKMVWPNEKKFIGLKD